MSLIETIHLRNVKETPWRGLGAGHQTANEFAFKIGEVLNRSAEQLRNCRRVAVRKCEVYLLRLPGRPW